MMQNEPVKIEEAAALLNTTTAAIRQKIKRGTIQAIKDKLTGRWLIYLDYPTPPVDCTNVQDTVQDTVQDNVQDNVQDTIQIISILKAENIALKEALKEANNQRDQWYKQALQSQQSADKILQALTNQQILSLPENRRIPALPDQAAGGNWWSKLKSTFTKKL